MSRGLGPKEPLKNHQWRAFFSQINGTAMGTKIAPSYANIFMGKLEKQIIQPSPHFPGFVS
jgi:hypothetical protein